MTKKTQRNKKSGLAVARYFTIEGADPLYEVVWERRQSVITNPDGSVVFKMEGAEIPSGWSQLATDIVVSKYFRKAGLHGKKELGETSVRQVVHRLARTIREAGEHFGGYFATAKDADAFEAELSYLLVHQYGAFNSPVWFNCGLWHRYGIEGSGGNWAWDEHSPSDAAEMFETGNAYERPQCSACFIQGVGDDLMSIFDLVRNEARLFKYGSGTGTNFSAIRGKQEKLSGGGTSSGLMSFLEVFDRAAGATKSGGTTRRAAKMVCLDMDHPEIVDFVEWKAREERKAQALISCGFPADFNGEAYRTVGGQNSNNSVRVSDEFMEAVMSGDKWHTRARTTGEIVETLDARSLWRKVSEAAWACADPGVQYHSTINSWHTCPNTGSINASNPCQPAWAPVLTPKGIRTIGEVEEGDSIWSGTKWTRIVKKWSTGVKPVYAYRTRAGVFYGTENHRVVSEGVKIEAKDAESIDVATGPMVTVTPSDLHHQTIVDGLVLGDGGVKTTNQGRQRYTLLYIGQDDHDYLTSSEVASFIHKTPFDLTAHRVETRLSVDELPHLPFRRIPTRYRNGSPSEVCSFLRGLYSANGSVVDTRVTLKAASLDIIRDVQQMLSSIGIRSYYTVNKAKPTTFANGTYVCQESMDLNITTGRRRFQELIGFIQREKNERLSAACERPLNERRSKVTYDIVDVQLLGSEEVFDLTVENEEHVYWTGGLLVSNCSEYMFLDDSACNLASLNLTKFLQENGTFDVEAYRQAIRVFFLAQEILVDFSSYPTRQIAKNSHDYRPLGLGYANLGALLMRLGIPYDSSTGRSYAAALTAILSGHAYRVSAEIAAVKGPFPGYALNRQPMLNVMGMHRSAANAIERDKCSEDLRHAACEDWNEVIRLGQEHGFRNAQSTVLAPTGTIGLLMDCDTTGVEPDFALVKFKKLAGGGYFKIVNQSVGEALRRLGYPETEIREILAYVEEHMTIEGAPYLKESHYAVFDCANRCGKKGTRYLAPMSHVKMMAAVQPFISGAISKTVNLPNEATVDEIARIYEQGWGLGLKAVALYRDGCKASQPLSTTSEKSDERKKEETAEAAIPTPPQAPQAVRPTGLRVRLPKKRSGFTQEARVGGHKIFLRTGEYLDGSLGELFVDMHKEGAAFRSVMNCFAMSVSVGLQYGVPLETFVDQFTFTRFEPQGVVEGHENVKLATSIIDYVFRVLAIEYLHRFDLAHVPPTPTASAIQDPTDTKAQEVPLPAKEPKNELNAQLEEMMGDAPVCDMCGHITVRNGACYKCLNCGNSMGCS